jgi:hypothetical protein
MYTNHCHRVFTQLQLTNISIYGPKISPPRKILEPEERGKWGKKCSEVLGCSYSLFFLIEH